MNYPNWHLAMDILCIVAALWTGIISKNIWAFICVIWIAQSILLKLRMRN